MALMILRAVDLTAALLDGRFAHPGGDSATDTAYELILAYCARIELCQQPADQSPPLNVD